MKKSLLSIVIFTLFSSVNCFSDERSIDDTNRIFIKIYNYLNEERDPNEDLKNLLEYSKKQGTELSEINDLTHRQLRRNLDWLINGSTMEEDPLVAAQKVLLDSLF